MLLNLSDVLSDRHQTINETVQLDMEEFQTRAGTYSIVQKDPVMITVSHMKKREYRIQALCFDSMRSLSGRCGAGDCAGCGEACRSRAIRCGTGRRIR